MLVQDFRFRNDLRRSPTPPVASAEPSGVTGLKFVMRKAPNACTCGHGINIQAALMRVGMV
jgi:hypothetical protein